ncbi:NPC intracellular cholesterol transporter 2 homolog a-like [Neodiprion virginianus]|uniref:NPC intracellular cholesterol transporter 2 homolog a n=1 Tax=Neodiprion lecontei TaxID=441921 RepID=A0A6J0BK00_NEOLC|nr:NPC intracellular cholesterol transporter 2 homolog a [Neodiprion lecontei]XP_046627237.1 NPC intracellular cholesterol transporter 2 homolog a-like [Neodiprion virginianus]
MASTTFALVLFTLCLATGIQGDSTPYTSCSTVADPIDFRMDGCTETPCALYRGETASAEWDWEVTADTTTLTPRVKAIVLGLSISYDIGQEDACETLTNAECPLDAGEEVTYGLSMPVLASYPKLSLTIEFALLDDNGDAQVCFRVPVKVQDRS